MREQAATIRRVLAAVLAGCLVVGLGAGLVAWRWSSSPQPVAADTYQYARLAYAVDGDGTRAASLAAQHFVCHRAPALYPPPHCSRPRVPWAADRRYESIFAARLAYPTVVAAFLPMIGTGAFTAASLLLAGACALAAFAWARALGLSVAAALAAEALILVLPSGRWLVAYLPESAMLTGILVALTGVALVHVRGRPRVGLSLLAAGLAWTLAAKDADGIAAGCAIVAAATVIAAALPGQRLRALATGAVTAGVVGIFEATARWQQLAGIDTSMQDTFTHHFHRPLIHHPWRHLLAADSRTVSPFLQHFVAQRYPIVIAVVIAVLLVWRLRWIALFPAAVAATGLAIITLHPVDTEFSRLQLPVWIAAATAGAIAVDALARGIVRSRRRSW